MTEEQNRITEVIQRVTGWEFVDFYEGNDVMASCYNFASHHNGDEISFVKQLHGGRLLELSEKQAEHLADLLQKKEEITVKN